MSEQIECLTGTKPEVMIGDQGYKDADGNNRLLMEGIILVTPLDMKRATKGTSRWRRLRNFLRKRALIEPVIGHMKSETRLCRNFLKDWLGDKNHVLLAAAGWHLRKLLGFLWAWVQSVEFKVSDPRDRFTVHSHSADCHGLFA